MPVIQFESIVEGNLIRIPEQYIGQIPYVVTVTLGDVGKFQTKNETLSVRQRHRIAFEEFFTAMAEIDDEPLDEEFDAILANRVNITRNLSL